MTPEHMARHAVYKAALLPAAIRAIERGEWDRELGTRRGDSVKEYEIAELVAHFAATDLVLAGRTTMLPMSEVAVALPEFGERKAA